MRARRNGVDLYVVTDSEIQHKVSRSFSAGPASLLGSYYFLRNGLRFNLAFTPRYLPRFALMHLIRPTLSDLVRWNARSGLMFRWIGALAAVTGRKGRAPNVVQLLAERQKRD